MWKRISLSNVRNTTESWDFISIAGAGLVSVLKNLKGKTKLSSLTMHLQDQTDSLQCVVSLIVPCLTDRVCNSWSVSTSDYFFFLLAPSHFMFEEKIESCETKPTGNLTGQLAVCVNCLIEREKKIRHYLRKPF